jgi:hypothetical protein
MPKEANGFLNYLIRRFNPHYLIGPFNPRGLLEQVKPFAVEPLAKQRLEYLYKIYYRIASQDLRDHPLANAKKAAPKMLKMLMQAAYSPSSSQSHVFAAAAQGGGGGPAPHNQGASVLAT